MPGSLQAASARLRAVGPGRRWSTWLEQANDRRRRVRAERVEMLARLQEVDRRERRSGEYAPSVRRW